MRRRTFIALLGGAAAAWPLAVRAQQRGMRRIGVLTDLPSDDSEAQVRNAAFLQGLQELGWTVGRNLQIDFRWGKGRGAGPLREYAVELVALAPLVILAVGVSSVTALQQAGGSVPMVFVQVSDPVGAGFVANLARRAATSLDSPCKNMASARNDWSCSSRLHRTSREQRSCGTPAFPRGSDILPQSSQWRPRSGWI
jgi:ABC-type uncharacterized transport system substrate-binding protein